MLNVLANAIPSVVGVLWENKVSVRWKHDISNCEKENIENP
jgi:hypothetical protein